MPASTTGCFSDGCTVATRLLQDLRKTMENIPDTIPHADEAHALAIFAGNPADYVSTDQDDWEDVLNPMMHRAFGYGADAEDEGELRGLARCGGYGLDGFCRFMEYFVAHRRLQVGLFEGKIKILLAAMNFECVM
jgi:hypothetical protein